MCKQYRRLLLALGLISSLMLFGCIQSSAVDDFAKVAQQADSLFPAVAMIPYQDCVTMQKDTQLQNVTSFNGTFEFDDARINAECRSAKATSDRLLKSYRVLTTYVTTLAKLAGGYTPTYDKTLKEDIDQIPGVTSAQKTALSGLAGVIADIVEKGYRQKEAAKAIHNAQPAVHALSEMLKNDLPAFLNQYNQNTFDATGSKYRLLAARHTDATLVAQLYDLEIQPIRNQQTAVAAFERIFAKIDEGHTALDNSRNHLFDKKTISDLFQTASDIKEQIGAVVAAFTPAAD